MQVIRINKEDFYKSIMLDNQYYIGVGKMWDFGYYVTIKDYTKDYTYNNDIIYNKEHITLNTINKHLKKFNVKAIDTDL